MSALEAGTVQQLELEALPRRAPPFKLTKQWVKEMWWFLSGWSFMFHMVLAVIVAYNLIAVAFGRHILSHYHLWEGTVSPDADSQGGYLAAAAVAGNLAAATVFPLLVMLLRVYDEKKEEFRWRYIGLSKRLAYWCLFVGVIALSWAWVVVSGAALHPSHSYVTPKSMVGIYAFGSLLAFPSAVILALVIFLCKRKK
ncbi:hypothetical protein DL96DRAFT_1625291 [Flagelloscypha sp. PMI_526]|nr:hypothetical protein DL96DRAFT_1625291 [Flagelloscypha sp. PMI_526]